MPLHQLCFAHWRAGLGDRLGQLRHITSEGETSVVMTGILTQQVGEGHIRRGQR